MRLSVRSLFQPKRKKIHKMIVEGFKRQTAAGIALAKGEMHFRIAIHCMKAGRYSDAHSQFLEAAAYAERMYRFSEALRLYKEAISCKHLIDGKVHDADELLPTLYMGDCYRKVAEYEKAKSTLETCRERIEACDTSVAKNRRILVSTLASLALLSKETSDYKAARILYERALPMARELDQSAIFLAKHISGYAEVLRKSGEFRKAEELHREALAQKECLLPNKETAPKLSLPSRTLS